MNVAIVDDEVESINKINDLLNEYSFNIDLYSYNFDDLLNKKYDLIILDIELSNQSGIELSSKINIKYPYTMIIFITNYHQYVSDVYAVNHLFYIEKDHLNQYMPLAIEKAINTYQNIKSKDLVISWRKSNEYIHLTDIFYLERNARRTEIHTIRSSYLSLEKLDDLNLRLDESFLRCHQSFIVNMNYIYKIEKAHIVLKNKTLIPISRAYKNDVMIKYHNFLTK